MIATRSLSFADVFIVMLVSRLAIIACRIVCLGDLGFNHCAFIFITSAFYVRLYSSLLHSYQYSRLDQDLLLLDHVYLLILHSTCVYTHHFCSLINMLD